MAAAEQRRRVDAVKENVVGQGARFLAGTQPPGATQEPDAVRQQETDRPAEMVDIFSIDVPRRPRSKRNTTVVKLGSFNFRDLPSLYNSKTLSATPLQAATTHVTADEKTRRKAPRKPKSDAAPQRVVFDEGESQGQTRRPRRIKKPRPVIGEGLFASGAEFEELFSSEREAECSAAYKNERGRNYQKRSVIKSCKREGVRKRSLRSVIDGCLRQQRRRKTSRLVDAYRPRAGGSTLSSHRSLQGQPLENTSLPEAEPDCCPTISCLLKKGAIEAGECVELIPINSNLTIHGWVTHRGDNCD